MIVRLAMGLGVIGLSYYIGREVGRTEHWRDLERRRRAEPLEPEEYDDVDDSPDDSAVEDQGADS